MISEVMNQLDHNQEKNQTAIEETKNLRAIIVKLDNIVEYNKLKELADLVKYHSKLMSYYGLDLKTGKWNTKQFPVTQTDAQMEGINSDINTFNKAVRECNKYGEFLAKKYCIDIDIDEQVDKGSVITFRPPSPIQHNP
jgi:hypothetical protein